MRESNLQPYANLGIVLKRLREKQSKSAAEVSGAVEIEERKLRDFELGKSRPSEDILSLIIQHFGLKDDEAKELWRLAGYDNADEIQYFINDDNGEVSQSQNAWINPQDAKVVYTDMVQIMVNNYGVVINFMQNSGTNNKPLAVSRVGMSKDHAKSILEVLKKTLDQADTLQQKTTKQLPLNSKKQED